MIALFQTILFLSLFLLIFSYFIYPAMLAWLARNRNLNGPFYTRSELPKIAVVFAAYNEEKVIEEKMRNLKDMDYPEELLEIHIGLDCPSDRTAALIQENIAMKFPVFVHHFQERSGKANVLNKIFNQSLKLSDFEIVIMMDANIISKENCFIELAKCFKNEEIGQVGAVIENLIKEKAEIAEQEKFYIGSESKLKIAETKVLDSSIGAFGACYAIRSSLIKEIPSNYLMEDFYLSMHVLEQKFRSITNPDAIVYEDLPGSIQEEFKRKRRISTGNFQNLSSYYPLLWKANWKISFSFFSHKILRWCGSFFILLAIFSASFWFMYERTSFWASFFFGAMLLNLILPLLDILLKSVNINVNLLRLHRYFLLMNLAMFLGFIDWTKGVKTNIWKPTKRT
ncbi:MAG: glycosyltransferase [Bacteroidetes bacterium]|nr:glycosyltransferase [Bacteroidota bacterium]